MRVDFHSSVGSGVSPSEASLIYEFFREENLCALKTQGKKLILQMKWLGFFMCGSFAFLIMNGRNPEVPFSYLIGVVFIGIICLINLGLSVLQDIETDRRIAYSLREGKKLEREYPDIIGSKYFHILEAAYSYRAIKFGRLIPAVMVAVITIIGGMFLSIKVGVWFAATIAMFSVGVFSIGIRFYIRTTRKILLGDH